LSPRLISSLSIYPNRPCHRQNAVILFWTGPSPVDRIMMDGGTKFGPRPCYFKVLKHTFAQLLIY
jgi:hypothetical protein